MNTFRVTNAHGKLNVLNLKVSLSRFGLNPQEWVLIPESKNIFTIRNKAEPSLSLRGQCSRTVSRPAVWTHISLFSL